MTTRQVREAERTRQAFENRDSTLANLPGQILLDNIARNPACSKEWRKAAVEIMIDNKFPQAQHPELVGMVMEIMAERSAKKEVEDVVETAIEGPIQVDPVVPVQVKPAGPLRASVTTATL